MPRLGVVLSTLLALCACEDRSPSIAVAVAVDQRVASQVLDNFERQSGVRVDALYDTEGAKTSGLLATVRARNEGAPLGVWWSGECYATALLADDGLLAPMPSDLRAELDPRNVGSTHPWLSSVARHRVVAWRPETDDPPADWLDLTDPRFKGRIAMADPRFGTTRGHFGAIKTWLDSSQGKEAFAEWARKLAANQPLIVTNGNAGALEAVLRGEADFCATDSDDVACAEVRGELLMSTPLRHGAQPGEGPLLIPSTIAVIASGDCPEAWDLVRHLASAHSQSVIGSECGDRIPPGQSGDSLDVSPTDAARAMNEAVAEFMRAVAAQRAAASSAGAGM